MNINSNLKGGTKNGGRSVPCSEIVLDVVQPITNEPAYYFKTSVLKVTNTKAKRRGNDTNIDIDVDITLKAIWVDGNQKHHNDIVAELTIPFGGVKVGAKYKYPEVFPADNDDVRTPRPEEKEAWMDKNSSSWFLGVPVSSNLQGERKGKGTYSIQVKVREYDDFGERILKIAEFIDSNRGRVRGWIDNR